MTNTEEAVALLPCPFCGGRAVILDAGYDLLPFVKCIVCDTQQTMKTDARACVAAWNRRAAIAAIAAIAAMPSRAEVLEEAAKAVESAGFYRDESGERAAEIIRALSQAAPAPVVRDGLGSPSGLGGPASTPSASDTETGPQMLQRLGMDAAKWCAEMNERGIVSADPTPGESFHGWMCNAIMNAYDIGHAAGERRITNDDLLPLLRKALLIPRPWMLGSRNHPKAVTMAEWTDAVDSVCGAIDRAQTTWVDHGSKEARAEHRAEGVASVSPSAASTTNTDVERMREALEEIVNGLEARMETDGPPYTIARAALEGHHE